MIFIDSPAIGESLEVWVNHLQELNSMPTRMQKDESLMIAIKRAEQVMKIKEKYVNGVDISKLSKVEFNNLLKCL
jgi:hypothetical protein